MRVRLNTSPDPSATAPAATRPANWAREIELDTTSPRRLSPAQTTWVSRWVRDELELCEADFCWAMGSWETIASKTSTAEGGESGETFHVILEQEQLEQSDHEFRIAVAVQMTRGAIEGRGQHREDVLVLVEVDRERQASWLKSGFGPHGTRCEPPKWDDVWGRLRQQWELEEERDELSGDVVEGGLIENAGENVGETVEEQAA